MDIYLNLNLNTGQAAHLISPGGKPKNHSLIHLKLSNFNDALILVDNPKTAKFNCRMS